MHGKEVAMSPISRRTFLTSAATAAGSVALGCGDHPMSAPRRAQPIGGLLPDPASPNRSYQHAGHTSRIENSFAISQLPTIWDRLAARGLVGRYYYSDLPFLGLWGAKYVPISRPIDAFYADCAAGTLPHVAFVDGSFLQELTGTGADDHPYGDVRPGEAMMNRIYAAVTQSPAWRSTVGRASCRERV